MHDDGSDTHDRLMTHTLFMAQQAATERLVIAEEEHKLAEEQTKDTGPQSPQYPSSSNQNHLRDGRRRHQRSQSDRSTSPIQVNDSANRLSTVLSRHLNRLSIAENANVSISNGNRLSILQTDELLRHWTDQSDPLAADIEESGLHLIKVTYDGLTKVIDIQKCCSYDEIVVTVLYELGHAPSIHGPSDLYRFYYNPDPDNFSPQNYSLIYKSRLMNVLSQQPAGKHNFILGRGWLSQSDISDVVQRATQSPLEQSLQGDAGMESRPLVAVQSDTQSYNANTMGNSLISEGQERPALIFGATASSTTHHFTAASPQNSLSNTGPPFKVFKHFQVGFNDPCYKVLPAALKECNINADWRRYVLYIVCCDEERLLEYNEKPYLIYRHHKEKGCRPILMLGEIVSLLEEVQKETQKFRVGGAI